MKCKKYRKFKNPEMSYIFYKTLVIFIICGKCSTKHKKVFKEEKSIEILGLIKNINIITLKIWRKKTLDKKQIKQKNISQKK